MSVEVKSPKLPDAGTGVREVRLFVNGEWRTGAGEREVLNPATERPACLTSLASPDDLDKAVAGASKAFPAWAATSGHERGALLKRAADLVDQRHAAIAEALSAESGKTRVEAAAEIERAKETLRWNGEEASRIEGRVIPGRVSSSVRYSIPTPLGVVAALTAWNFPAVLVARKVGAALAAGCTVVLKAAEQTPSAAAELVHALDDAGAPAGTINLVFGDPRLVTTHVLDAPEVRAITFTGSTSVGRAVAENASRNLKRLVLELGGHAPVIICDDADLELAVRTTVPAKFGSAGQSCVAPSRFYIHASRYSDFVESFVGAVTAIRVGPPSDENVQMGPVLNAGRLEAMQRLTRNAVESGSRLLCGGERLGDVGFFWAPTVLSEVPEDAQVMNEEPFGPIAALAPFTHIDEALDRANRTGYGLAAYLFTNSLATQAEVLAGLYAGNIGINQMAPSMPDAPLGGLKDSGYGYEGGREGITAFQHFRLVTQAGV